MTITFKDRADELVRSKAFYLFAQDSWKLRSNLTMNFGLRWELNTPLKDIGQKVQTFRPGRIQPSILVLHSSRKRCAAGRAPHGLVVPGDRESLPGLPPLITSLFAPRIGLAWSPDAKRRIPGKPVWWPGKTSVRAGSAFLQPGRTIGSEQFSAEPPFGGSSSISTPCSILPSNIRMEPPLPIRSTGF